MADLCLTCDRVASSEDPMYSCDGFCKRWVHRSCLGASNTLFKELNKSSQYLWMCPGCAELRCSGRLLVLADLTAALADLKAQFESRQADLEARLVAATEATKLAALSSCTLHKDTAALNSVAGYRTALATHFTITTTTPAPLSTNPAKRRLVDRSPPTADTTPALLTGTAPIETSSQAALLLPPELPKFWLYLSRCRPLATALDVLAFVKEQLGTEDVIVRKLVPLNKDLSTLTFSSFKVGLSLELRERALSPSSWPIGTVFKEFTNRRSLSQTVHSATVADRLASQTIPTCALNAALTTTSSSDNTTSTTTISVAQIAPCSTSPPPLTQSQ